MLETDPGGVCVKTLPVQIEKLAKKLTDLSTLSKDTPFYNPSVGSRERCKFLKQMIDMHATTLQNLSDYLRKHHPEFVEDTLAKLNVGSALTTGVESVLRATGDRLEMCLISPFHIEQGLAKNRDKAPQIMLPISEAIQRIFARLQEVGTKDIPYEERRREASEHVKALEWSMEIRHAAASYR